MARTPLTLLTLAAAFWPIAAIAQVPEGEDRYAVPAVEYGQAPSTPYAGNAFAPPTTPNFGASFASPEPAPGYAPAEAAPPAYPSTDQPAYPTTTPAAPAAPAAAPRPQTPGLPPMTGNAQPLPGGTIVARIAGEIVLASDVSEGIDELLAANRGRVPEAELEKARWMLIKRNVDQLIDTKLLYAEARRSIPKENHEKIEEQIDKQFEKERLPSLYKVTKTSERAELEAALKKLGTTIAHQRRAYGEKMLAQQWLRQSIKLDEEITHDEMLDYYQQHAADFEFEAKARWEEMSVRFERFGSKHEAYRAMAGMGNEVWGGAKFAEVAQAKSHGVTADKGGEYDWTSRGSLVSEELNKALFTLPVGQLSPIIESQFGFHIIRVVERRDAGRTSFVEAQADIKKKIKDGRTDQQIQQYLTNLRKNSRVWTIFDEHPELAQMPQ